MGFSHDEVTCIAWMESAELNGPVLRTLPFPRPEQYLLRKTLVVFPFDIRVSSVILASADGFDLNHFTLDHLMHFPRSQKEE